MPPPRIRDTETGLRLLGMRRRAFDEAVERLAGRLGRDEISLVDWRTAMQREIRDLHRTALLISRGGEWGSITFAEWGRLGGHLRKQYRYLNDYAEAIRARLDAALVGEGKPPSEKYLAWRSKLYGGNANAAYWRGMTYGLLKQVPGDGQTQCKTNCGCSLRIEEGDEPDRLHVYWELGETEHCPDCVRLSAEWNPYVLKLPAEMAIYARRLGLSLREFVGRLLGDQDDQIGIDGHSHPDGALRGLDVVSGGEVRGRATLL